MKTLFVAIVFLFVTSSHAFVDLRNANYTNTWVDIQVEGSGFDMKALRTYHSRTLHNGMFGFGWCSNFETRLEVQPEGTLKTFEHGCGAVVTYSPQAMNKVDIEKVVNQIIAKVKAEKKVGLGEDFYKKLKAELLDSPEMRSKLAQKYEVKPNIKEGTKFLAAGSGVETIILEKEYYTRNMGDGTSQRFTLDGKLLAVYDKNNRFLKFKYDKDLLKELEDDLGRRMTFKYYSNKRVKEITAPGGMKAEYKYTGLEDLTWVKNGWKNIFTYEYDDVHNLTKAVWPDKTFIQLKYSKKDDWVISLQDRDKCLETYNYETSKTDPRFHYWSTLKKVCGKKVVTEDRYEFWHRQREDGEVYLHRLLTKVGGNITDITYDDQFGKPIALRRNAEKVTFDYYPNGLLKAKAAAQAKLTFEYHAELKKISTVTTSFFNEKGEKISSKTAQFKYDNKGNISTAQNSDGQQVSMTYDQLGRMVTITDQAKKVVKLEYEERFGKPHIVTRPGLGSIKINYKPNGEMKDVDSPQGPSVALQVASTFNNYLDVLAPATQDMYSL